MAERGRVPEELDQNRTMPADLEANPSPDQGMWPQDDPRPFRKRAAAKWLLAAVMLAVAIVAFFVWHHYSVRESTDDAQLDAHIVPVNARVAGTVLRIMVEDNQSVKAGDVLVELDPKDYQIALQRAQADLADAEANAIAARTGIPLASTTTSTQLQSAEAGVAASQREAEAARARSREAQANYTKVEADLTRAKQLIAKDEISRQQYDAVVAAEQAASATVQSAQAMVAMSTSRISQARAQAEGARTVPQQVQISRARSAAAAAAVDRFRSAVEQARLNLQYSVVRAAVSGTVSKRNVEPGQVVQQGQALVSLVDLDDIWVTANLKETQLKNLRPGQEVEIKVDAYGKTYKGQVDSFGAATGARFSMLPPENATGNYVKVVQRIPVKIVFKKGQDLSLLRPGMSVQPVISTK